MADHSKTGWIGPVFEWLKQNGGQKQDFGDLTTSLDCFTIKQRVIIFFSWQNGLG